MFCKITRSRVSPEKIPQLEKWVEKKWGSLISTQMGFNGYYFLVKPNGEFTMIMLWKDEANVQSWTDNPDHQALIPEFKALVIAPVEMDLYGVSDACHP